MPSEYSALLQEQLMSYYLYDGLNFFSSLLKVILLLRFLQEKVVKNSCLKYNFFRAPFLAPLQMSFILCNREISENVV